ncbi:MAG: hypothetical protein ABI091_05280, partial [Ferruginibacter sp.]
MKKFKCLAIALLACHCFDAQCQSKGITEMEKALQEKKFDQAAAILKTVTEDYFDQRVADSLVNYIFYTGKIANSKSGPKEAAKKVEAFIQKIKSISSAPSTLRQASLDAGEFYGSLGLNTAGYKSNE